MGSEGRELNLKDKDNLLINIIQEALKLPGVKVNRDSFLRGQFKKESPESIEAILDKGPVEAGIAREVLLNKAKMILTERTATSTAISAAAGIPGGYAMIATIPADILQYYGVALRFVQEMVYLYGGPDIWENGKIISDSVHNNLILYIGVMVNANGASQLVKLMSSKIAQQILKKIPEKALTKTFYYPLIKSIARFFGTKMTKTVFAQGVSKIVPFVGAAVSGGVTLVSMTLMGNRLLKVLDKSNFSYTEEEIIHDYEELEEMRNKAEKKPMIIRKAKSKKSSNLDLNQIKEAKKMLDDGIITEEEFGAIKKKIIG